MTAEMKLLKARSPAASSPSTYTTCWGTTPKTA